MPWPRGHHATSPEVGCTRRYGAPMPTESRGQGCRAGPWRHGCIVPRPIHRFHLPDASRVPDTLSFEPSAATGRAAEPGGMVVLATGGSQTVHRGGAGAERTAGRSDGHSRATLVHPQAQPVHPAWTGSPATPRPRRMNAGGHGRCHTPGLRPHRCRASASRRLWAAQGMDRPEIGARPPRQGPHHVHGEARRCQTTRNRSWVKGTIRNPHIPHPASGQRPPSRRVP